MYVFFFSFFFLSNDQATQGAPLRILGPLNSIFTRALLRSGGGGGGDDQAASADSELIIAMFDQFSLLKSSRLA